jgi:hypothetical protein
METSLLHWQRYRELRLIYGEFADVATAENPALPPCTRNSNQSPFEILCVKDNTYPYDHTQASRYTFTSIGKKRIVKEVVFTYTGLRNIVNMGFGDVLPDGSVDDKANSNNGDIIRVLATILQILIDFTSKFPDTEIFFSGSMQERTKLYTRILRTYYSTFNKHFIINVLIEDGEGYAELPFEPKADLKFLGFLVKRID